MRQTNIDADVNVYKDMKALLDYTQKIKINTSQYLEKRRWFALPQNVAIVQNVSNFMESSSLENWVRTLEELIKKFQTKTNFAETNLDEIEREAEVIGNSNTIPDNDFFQLLKEISAHLMKFSEISKKINEEIKKIKEQELFWVASPAYKDIKGLFEILESTITYSAHTITCMIGVQKIYEDSLKRLNEEREKVEKQKKELMEEKEKMKVERRDVEEKVFSLNNQIEVLKDKVNALTLENEGLLELCGQLNVRMEGLTSDLDKAKKEIEQLQEEVAVHTRKEKKMLHDIDLLKQDIESLGNDLKKANEENKELKKTLKKSEKEYKDIIKNEDANRETIRAQQNNINELKEKIKSAGDKERKLQQELHARCTEVLALQKEVPHQRAHAEVNSRSLGFFKKASLPGEDGPAPSFKESNKPLNP